MSIENILPLATDPFWDVSSPANGFGCSCSSNILSDADLELSGDYVDDGWDKMMIGDLVEYGCLIRPCILNSILMGVCQFTLCAKE